MPVKAIIFDASDVLYDHRGIHKPIMKLISELSKKYKIGMITNLPTNSIDDYFSSEQQSLFDYIHTYGKAGLSKPDPAAFKHAAEELDLAPEDCIYIDDMYANTHGAEAAGMQTIIYKDFDIFEHQLTKILAHDE